MSQMGISQICIHTQMSVPQKGRQSQQKSNAVTIAVSACLMGEKVRYDGGDKKNNFVLHKLAKVARMLPICPEVEIGLGVPRPPIHIVEFNQSLHAVGVDDPSLDVTKKLIRFGNSRSRLPNDVCGYIFKARSPSCGVDSTPVALADGRIIKGAGLFAAEVTRRLPLLPVVEEEKLVTEAQQVNFLQRVAGYQRWLDFIGTRPGRQQLLQFHQYNRLVLMSHGAEGLRELDDWLAGASTGSRGALLQGYGERYMAQFARQATMRCQALVLRRCSRLLRHAVDGGQYAALLREIEHYLAGKRPLADVIGTLRDYQRLAQVSELEGQTYLEPEKTSR
jgi:uncharacterized protein YbbK (DUF523 family)/uncharacterized protein YbgA (DUF1722 family)